MAKPFLSIGIIFRDDIRCIERCLSSLAPLRQAIPCEVVMADTGSVDGSRAVAEKYADILFDFPWVDDFSAARNAVIDRCSGRWHLAVDTDEWLDGDIKELVSFIRANNKKAGVCCTVCQRNYMDEEDARDYRDFMAARMFRMSTGMRYHGTIHERLDYEDNRPYYVNSLYKTVLHHDGYLDQESEAGMAKKKRNMDLLVKELEKDPENIQLLMQCIESTGASEASMEYVRRGIEATEKKRKGWERTGPVIFRYGIVLARALELEELLEWAARAYELFPQSFYTQIDVNYEMFVCHWVKNDYDGCIRCGEGYLGAIADYRAGRGDLEALNASTLGRAAPNDEQEVRSVLVHAYLQTGRPEDAAKTLDKMDFSTMDTKQTVNSLLLLKGLQKDTDIDTAPLLLRLYGDIGKPTPNEKWAEERKKIFSDIAAGLFTSMEEEERSEGFKRYSCTMLAPLAGQYELGDAAAVLAAEGVQEKEQALLAADKPYAMPREVLRRAILSGVAFPLRDRPLNKEEMDALAASVAREDGLEILKQAVDGMDAGLQQLSWAKSVALAVVGAWKWEDSEQSMDLARTFAWVEGVFLPRCYAPESLREENLLLLPPMHRLGWYCGRAFEALDAGDSTGYVRLLQAGLESVPSMKDMVKFLTEHVPELQTPAPSAELLALAEKVRTMLSMFSPDDPAVAELKASPVYQEVAHLIEGVKAPVMGGLPQ